MYSKDCRNKIRYSLSDASGVLRFTAFNIVDALECGDTPEMLRKYLVGRPLADVDVDYIRGLGCKGDVLKDIYKELKVHVPFTVVGTLTGMAIFIVMVYAHTSQALSHTLFWTFHPFHVLLSAIVTAGIYRLHNKSSFWATVLIGYFGSIGIATLSDCIIPYIGEYLLGLPNRDIHLGFIEKWWLVNPLAIAGITIAFRWPKTKLPHAGHVLLSTWASLFHMTMALDSQIDVLLVIMIAVFLFLAVWVPCCTSDIVFPLLFSKKQIDWVPKKTNYYEGG